MTEFEFLENCLNFKDEDTNQNLIEKFLKGRGKPKNPCEMTDEVSFFINSDKIKTISNPTSEHSV